MGGTLSALPPYDVTYIEIWTSIGQAVVVEEAATLTISVRAGANQPAASVKQKLTVISALLETTKN